MIWKRAYQNCQIRSNRVTEKLEIGYSSSKRTLTHAVKSQGMIQSIAMGDIHGVRKTKSSERGKRDPLDDSGKTGLS